METTTTYTQTTGARSTVFTTLAAVGFVALIAFGIWLAVYSARFVPGTVSHIGSAAVALGSVFNSGSSGVATTTAPSTISFGDATSTPTTTPSTGGSTTSSGSTGSYNPQPGQKTSTTQQISGSGPTSYYGLPDLQMTISAVGYLTNNTTDSFVAASSVPTGYRPAVKFTVKNVGTNVAGAWRFSATIPTTTFFTYQSLPQQALNPGDSIDYTLGFDSAQVGTGKTITVTANFDNAISDANSANNVASGTLNVN